jgi:hypothetical protein
MPLAFLPLLLAAAPAQEPLWEPDSAFQSAPYVACAHDKTIELSASVRSPQAIPDLVMIVCEPVLDRYLADKFGEAPWGSPREFGTVVALRKDLLARMRGMISYVVDRVRAAPAGNAPRA